MTYRCATRKTISKGSVAATAAAIWYGQFA